MGLLVAVFSLAAISLVLMLVRFDEFYFSLGLFVFTAFDITTWLYLRLSFLPPIIEATRARYKADHDEYGLLHLKLVVFLVIGNWKWWRQGLFFNRSIDGPYGDLGSVEGFRLQRGARAPAGRAV